MMNRRVFFLSVLWLASQPYPRFGEPALARPVGPPANGSTLRQAGSQHPASQVSDRIHREREAEERFLTDFLRLGPRERVAAWQSGKDVTGRGLIQSAMDDALVTRGIDAVPYLADIVLHGDSSHQAYAVKILCDMDRFVPRDRLPVPALGGSSHTYARAFGLEGLINPFILVDGRLIGEVGCQAIKWAAEQTESRDLRFHARQYSGLLEGDLRKLTLREQVALWREGVARSKGLLGLAGDTDSYSTAFYLKEILIEQAPESIPLLLEILANDGDGYVREEAISLLTMIDSFQVRLRATELGRRAIEEIHRALDRGGLKPVYTSKQACRAYWIKVSSQVFDDNVQTFSMVWAVAFKEMFGVPLEVDSPFVFNSRTAPQLRQFVTYLTKVDPFFPSWEFTYLGQTGQMMLHPQFKHKMARYYEQWKQFKAGQSGGGGR